MLSILILFCLIKYSYGYNILKSPLYNKGHTFTESERNKYNIRGLLPCGKPISLENKVELSMEQLRKKVSPLEKYIYLHTIQDADETLFYAILNSYIDEVLPYVYTPTVGQACQEWSHIYRHTPRGLYLSIKDKSQIRKILDNYPEDSISTIVVTDGERILGLGDLGCNGMGIPIGKLALYTACAGINPKKCLPVHIDVGTNNNELINDPMYMGLKHKRIRGKEYDDLIKEFIDACQDKYGREVLIQFEDFGNSNAFRILDNHKNSTTCFNDDIQGTASVILAGIIASLPLVNKTKIADHTFLFYGAGEAGVGIANMIALAIHKESGISIEEARKNIWLIDSYGLVCSSRTDDIADHKKSYMHKFHDNYLFLTNLVDCIEKIRPTALIGVSAQGGSFNEDVLKLMANINEKPLIFALSNPTSKAECTSQEAYEFTDGKCIYASGSPMDPVTLSDGRSFIPGQGNNAYIFPGVGLGAFASKAMSITDDDLYVAAKCLARQVSDERLMNGCIYPPFTEIREVSANIAAAVADNICKDSRGFSPKDLVRYCKNLMYKPVY